MIALGPTDVGRFDPDAFWYLRLYVAGQTAKSVRAVANLKRLCENHLTGLVEIEIIDLIEEPGLARADDIVAIPTLGAPATGPELQDHRRPVRHRTCPRRTVPPAIEPRAVMSGEMGFSNRTPGGDAAHESLSYELTLYVCGATELSARAIATVSRWCESHLSACHRLAFVDVSAQPGLASANGILVTPTLVKTQPSPPRRVIGDLSSPEAVLRALGIPTRSSGNDDGAVS